MGGLGEHLEGLRCPWGFIKPSIPLERGIKIHYIDLLVSLWVPEPPRKALWGAQGGIWGSFGEHLEGFGCPWGFIKPSIPLERRIKILDAFEYVGLVGPSSILCGLIFSF